MICSKCGQEIKEMNDPKYLYHYTSQKGLLGILDIGSDKSKPKLWMTNILYLNDSNEFSHPMSFFQKEWKDRVNKTLDNMYSKGIIKKRLNTNNIISMKTRLGKVVFQELIHEIGMNIFIFSLSGKQNNLSQWRGYCPNSGGFSIGFDREKLSDIVKKKDNYEIRKCIYKDNIKLRFVKTIFSKYFPDYKTNIEEWIMNKNDDPITKFFLKMIQKSPFLKDESFIDEDEYRIVFNNYKGEDIKCDEGKTMIKPHYEGDLTDEDGKLPINKIWVGPTPNPELSKLSVESLLKSKGYNEVEVVKSEIPYRPL